MYATGGMSAVLFLLLIVLGFCVYLLIYQSRLEEDIENYKDSDLPFGFGQTSRLNESRSTTSVARSNYGESRSNRGDFSMSHQDDLNKSQGEYSRSQKGDFNRSRQGDFSSDYQSGYLHGYHSEV